MIQKLLIKKYKNFQDSKIRNKCGAIAGIFGIISNLVLFIIKLGIGIVANSVTIIADAFNNLSDSGSSIITLLGFKLTNKPADKEHPYGHARYEYITGIVIDLLILCMGAIFAKTSIEKIFFPENISINIETYIILIIAILGKVIQMIVYLDFSKLINSTTLKSTAMDSRNDIITTSAVLFAVLIMGIFNINIDAYMGLIVSIFIIISAIKMIRETINPLLGSVMTQEQVEEIKNKILTHKEVKGIHDLVIHNYGVGNDFATVHVEVSSEMTLLVAHNLADSIEKELKKDLGIDFTIHIDPIELDDIETSKLKDKVKEILNKVDNTLEIHDFRIISDAFETKVIFDVIVPFEKDYTAEMLNEILQREFKREEGEYEFIITIDRPFY